MKTKVGQRKPLTKLIAFKAIVGVIWIQQIVFSFLTSAGDLKPSSKLTYRDLTIVIPNLVVSFEMIIFSLVFLKVFRISEYNIKKGSSLEHGTYYGGSMGAGALFEALNFSDVVIAIIGALKGGLRNRQGYTKTQAYRVGAQDGSVRIMHSIGNAFVLIMLV